MLLLDSSNVEAAALARFIARQGLEEVIVGRGVEVTRDGCRTPVKTIRAPILTVEPNNSTAPFFVRLAAQGATENIRVSIGNGAGPLVWPPWLDRRDRYRRLEPRQSPTFLKWKVKIRDKETREPPHLTIIRGTDAWRINLRTGEFMDPMPDPTDVPNEVIEIIRVKETWQQLCNEWDGMYPNNPVSGEDENEE